MNHSRNLQAHAKLIGYTAIH